MLLRISNLCLRSLFKQKLWCVHLNSKPPIQWELTIRWQIQLLYRFPRWCRVKNLPANAGDCKRRGFDPWVGNISWSRKWQPTLVLLPGKFHGQRWLVGYSPWGRTESNMTQHTVHICDFYTTLKSLHVATLHMTLPKQDEKILRWEDIKPRLSLMSVIWKRNTVLLSWASLVA